MRLLALDIATTTGWARWLERVPSPESGSITFPSEIGEFADSFERWLVSRLQIDRIDQIAIEAPIPATGKTRFDVLFRLYGAHVIVRKVGFWKQVPVQSVPIAAWRTHFIGQSRAPKHLNQHERRKWLKQQVVGECQRRGWPVADDNAADACGLISYVRSHHDPEYAIGSTPLFGAGYVAANENEDIAGGKRADRRAA